jgi:hypothetical protein
MAFFLNRKIINPITDTPIPLNNHSLLSCTKLNRPSNFSPFCLNIIDNGIAELHQGVFQKIHL